MTHFESQKNTLTTLLEQVTMQLSDIAVHNQLTDDWEISTPESSTADTDVQADAAESADIQAAELAELENRYRTIVRALEKINTGTYGVCEISGEEIEADRLTANPAARTCKAHMESEYALPQP